MAAIPDLKLGIEIASVAIVRPGDTLILGFRRRVDEAECDRVSRKVAAELPGVRVAVIDQLAHMAVFRPQADAPPDHPGGY